MPPADAVPLTIGCLASGGGRTVLHLNELCASGQLPGRVGVVVVTRPDAPAVSRCRDAGLTVEVVPPDEGVDDRIDEALRRHGVSLVCLCGFLRRFRVAPWHGRCLNVHPALLPRHGGPGMWGARVHAAVLAAGDTESGCTIHAVDEHYDHGAPIVQRRCPVLDGDTPQSLAERVFAEERAAWPIAIGRWLASQASD